MQKESEMENNTRKINVEDKLRGGRRRTKWKEDQDEESKLG